jgi:hypothetical protein
LGQAPFFSGSSHENLEQINGQFHEYGFASNETIDLAGDSAQQLTFDLWKGYDGKDRFLK